MTSEEWKPIVGYEELYEVSSFGRIRSLDRVVEQLNNGIMCKHIYKGKMMRVKKESNGYLRIRLSKDGIAKDIAVHRIVAQSFVPNPHNKPAVNHIDCNPENNVATNLEWVTYKENMQWASKQGRMKGNPHNFDKAHERSKKPVIAIDKKGNRFRFESQKDAAKAIGVNPGHIAALCRKEYGYKQSHGYVFEYADEEYQKTLKPNKVKMPDEERTEFLRNRMKGNQYGKNKKPSKENIDKIKQITSKPICQFDKNGNFIKEYESSNSVLNTTGIHHSCDVANGKRKTAGGYIWRWKEAI